MQWSDVALTTVQIPAAGHEVVALIGEQVEQVWYHREVIGVIGVTHDQVLPARAGEAL
jgi:hypothetical protein